MSNLAKGGWLPIEPSDGAGQPAGIIQGAFGRVSVNPLARALVPHVHAEYNLLIKLQGPDPLFLSGKERLPLSDGAILMFNAWQVHRKEPSSEGPSLFLAMLIDPAWLDRVEAAVHRRGEDLFAAPLVAATPLVQEKTSVLVRAITGTAAQADGVYEGLVADLMRAVVAAYGVDEMQLSQRMVDARIRKAIRFLKANARLNPSLEDVATEVGMSRSRFFEQFKNTTGATPQQYLDWARLAAATDGLANGSMSIADLAETLGFSEQTHFTRFFQQRMGLSPTMFRRRAFVLNGDRS